MPRVSERQYQWRSMAAMVVYVAIVMAVREPARDATNLAAQLLYAVLPVVPIVYVVWQLARRIWTSDELEQRTHLIGLAAATGVIAVLSLVAGFLAAGKVISLENAGFVLLLIFPLLMLIYAGTRAFVARRYGSDGLCDNDRVPRYQTFGVATLLFAAVTIWAWHRGVDDFRLGVFSGMTAAMALAAIVFGVRRWRARRDGPAA